MPRRPTRPPATLADKRLANPQVSAAEVEAQYRRARAGYNEALVHLKDCLHNFPENPSTLLIREQLGLVLSQAGGKTGEEANELDREKTAELSTRNA